MLLICVSGNGTDHSKNDTRAERELILLRSGCLNDKHGRRIDGVFLTDVGFSARGVKKAIWFWNVVAFVEYASSSYKPFCTFEFVFPGKLLYGAMGFIQCRLFLQNHGQLPNIYKPF